MMKMNRLAVALALTGVLFANGSALAGGTARDANAELYIGWPNDGEVLRKSAVKVWFGLRNMGVAPAGIAAANAGHHHLILDAGLPDSSEPIPNNENYLHFGKGQTETVVTLSRGVHTLQLNFADKDHLQFDPPLYSKKITITVK